MAVKVVSQEMTPLKSRMDEKHFRTGNNFRKAAKKTSPSRKKIQLKQEMGVLVEVKSQRFCLVSGHRAGGYNKA